MATKQYSGKSEDGGKTINISEKPATPPPTASDIFFNRLGDLITYGVLGTFFLLICYVLSQASW